ncbi:hypothetical protein KHM83_14245 [Fusibacter paucivorans]|uniref:Uncharacterized protein n=1 Tax=Fusibacter paucivorans TaxID=76009 RepID=A0ABS5PU04_9FIRM|nr:DUF4795 domain-containing protein [Fusibacter paucivorans]MBS7527841.1 hypothetical protein [Fusibacter paucivorans]
MAYPENADIFQEKLNKKEAGNYVVEEHVTLTNGKYEGFLIHDNVSTASINIYRGPKFTGGQITNYSVTTDSDRAWKKFIRVFDAGTEAYINYETVGDQVEAEDINTLQTSVHAVQQDVIDYKASNNSVIALHDERIASVESEKADESYVNEQLALKSDTANTYTKTETDARIQFVVDTAPEALDTLKEIADALDNDPDFAATMTAQLASKVDKAAGYGLSANDFSDVLKGKLDGIETGAEVNNLTDDAASELTGNSDSSLHYHTADRNRANHTGTQTSATISDFVTRVRTTVLTGLSTTTNTVITAADTILTAFGKLQAQVTVNKSEADLHAGSTNNPHAVSKAQVGLGNADNTADLSKPVSTAMKTALNQKAPLSHVGATGTAHGDATDTISGFMSADDKSKLDDVEDSANHYVHPATHSPAIIVQNTTNRFVTDAEKSTWNAKASTATATTTANGLMAAADKAKLGTIESSAEVNNISDANAADLTDGGASTLHYHIADRSRANHTGMQTASTISDFAASVRLAVLTGLSTASGAVITTADTVLTALGKLQSQVTANKTEASTHASSTANPHTVTKAQVGLGSVNNTADADKPVSTAMQTALNTKAPISHVGATGAAHGTVNGNVNGFMSVADKFKLDVIEDSANHYVHPVSHPASIISDFAASVRSAVLTGLSTASSAVITTADTVLTALGKLQAQISANKTEASTHANSTTNPHNVTKAQVGLGSVNNTADADKPVSTAMQTALNAKAPLASPTLTGVPKAPTATTGNNSTQLATTAFVQNALSTGGYGDMLKSVYDADGDGVVDEAMKLHTARNITLTGDATGSVSFNGSADASMTVTVIDNSHRHNYIYSSDDRDVKPSVTPKHYLSSYFASKGGLTGAADTNYIDLMVLNTYINVAGGYVNALAFDKTSKKIQHYQAAQTDLSWGTPKTIAYQEDSKTLTWGDLKNGFTLGG